MRVWTPAVVSFGTIFPPSHFLVEKWMRFWTTLVSLDSILFISSRFLVDKWMRFFGSFVSFGSILPTEPLLVEKWMRFWLTTISLDSILFLSHLCILMGMAPFDLGRSLKLYRSYFSLSSVGPLGPRSCAILKTHRL